MAEQKAGGGGAVGMKFRWPRRQEGEGDCRLELAWLPRRDAVGDPSVAGSWAYGDGDVLCFVTCLDTGTSSSHQLRVGPFFGKPCHTDCGSSCPWRRG